MPGIPATRGTRIERALPSVAQLLVQGGDARIALDPLTGRNKYGCAPYPDTGLLTLGSSTASVISEAGFAAATALHARIAASAEPDAVIYARELGRMRGELMALCGVAELDGTECLFATSGTDLHGIVARLAAASHDVPPRVVMVDAAETGSGVPAALAGQGQAADLAAVALRNDDGSLRAAEQVDAEVAALAAEAAAGSANVLLVMADVSKSGLLAPSLDCMLRLQRELGDRLEVLVDACQFRLAPATIRAYLEHGCLVALTGSKFVGGPSFSGALLVPAASSQRLRWRTLPPTAGGLRAEWPASWAAGTALEEGANFGLLLRWEAALAELRRFRALPETEIERFMRRFAAAISQRLAADEAFGAMPVAVLDRTGLRGGACWDDVQTIFPFLLYRRVAGVRQVLDEAAVREVYRLLPEMGPGALSARYQFGQPVACGRRDGAVTAALRLCLGARLVVEAVHEGQADKVIAEALAALDKAALLAQGLRA